MLRLENVTKTFSGKKILDNVSLRVERGEIAVLLGKSGVGKSTLLRVLNNLETMETGSVYLDNKKLDTATINRGHKIGMVFQQFNLFAHMTVEKNITFVLEKVLKKSATKARDIAKELLEHYGLSERAKVLVSSLSGGQKQRLAIARTVALKPQIICMDEPTSALDPLLTTHVATTIQKLADEGYMLLLASHDTALLEKLTCTIYLMDGGHIIESATSTDFFKNRSTYPLIDTFVKGEIHK
ncbi:amino acid ABC transporter ATP-binding protein [Candidatus Dependentiae bacterium]